MGHFFGMDQDDGFGSKPTACSRNGTVRLGVLSQN